MDRAPEGRATQKYSHPASPQDGLAERLRRRHTGESVNSGIMVRVWRYAVAHCRAFGDMIESKLLTTALAEPRQIAHSTCGTHTLARAAIRRGKFGAPLRLVRVGARWRTRGKRTNDLHHLGSRDSIEGKLGQGRHGSGHGSAGRLVRMHPGALARRTSLPSCQSRE